MIWNLLKRLFGRKTPQLEAGRTDTEFTAEVVMITQILPHPNADKLEIARFALKASGETTYEVVVQKAKKHYPGQYVGYFSVDCILPTSHPDFAFLKERLDGAGKELFRLKAARLRKVFSQGLIIELPPGMAIGENYGWQIAELYGVTYHRDPEPTQPGTAPQKPKAQPAPVYGVDSLKKLPNLFGENEAVYVTEKIHGTNFRFGWVRRKVLGIPLGWRFFVGSHRTERTPGRSSWYGKDLYSLAAERMGLKALTRGHKGKVFYGELYGHTYDGKSIQPGWTYGVPVEQGPQLVIFDVRDQSEGCWLSPFDRFDLVDNLGLKNAPVLHACLPADGVKHWEGKKSTLDNETIMEGVVAENIGGLRRKAKYVHQAYLEAN